MAASSYTKLPSRVRNQTSESGNAHHDNARRTEGEEGGVCVCVWVCVGVCVGGREGGRGGETRAERKGRRTEKKKRGKECDNLRQQQQPPPPPPPPPSTANSRRGHRPIAPPRPVTHRWSRTITGPVSNRQIKIEPTPHLKHELSVK